MISYRYFLFKYIIIVKLGLNNHSEGISLIYPEGVNCPFSKRSRPYKFQINLIWDINYEKSPKYYLKSDAVFDPWNPIVSIQSMS